jgi:hypothetical protein
MNYLFVFIAGVLIGLWCAALRRSMARVDGVSSAKYAPDDKPDSEAREPGPYESPTIGPYARIGPQDRWVESYPRLGHRPHPSCRCGCRQKEEDREEVHYGFY